MHLNIGDIITAYNKGYWRITRIEKRFVTPSNAYYYKSVSMNIGDEMSPLIHMELVVDSNLKRPTKKARTAQCDAAFCHKVTKQSIEDEKNKLLRFLEQLDDFSSNDIT